MSTVVDVSTQDSVEAQRLTYPISPEYVKTWTSERALAELIANAIDEDPDFTMEWENGVLRIEDSAHGIGDHGLMLGLSTKSDAQIGQWGEGLNIALLVLVRDRRIGDITVETVGYSFSPLLVRQRLVSVGTRDESELPQMLAIDIIPNDRLQGTLITVACPEALFKKARGRFLHFAQDEIDGNTSPTTAPSTPHYAPPPSWGRVIGDGAPGRVYIGGVLVADKRKLLFSYDFSLEQAKSMQNRDRTVVDSQAQDRLIAQALEHLDDPILLQRWVEAALKGKLAQAEQRIPHSPLPAQKRAFTALGKTLYGEKGKVCYAGEYGDEEATLDCRDRGYTVLRSEIPSWHFTSLMRNMGISSAKSLYRKPPSPEVTVWCKKSDLSQEEKDNLATAISIVRAVFGKDAVGACAAYESTRIEGTDEDLAFGGFYTPNSAGKIGIQRKNLKSLADTVRVLGHEAAHRLRHRNARWDWHDRSRGFETQLDTMLGKALIILHENGAVEGLSRVAEQKSEEDAQRAEAYEKAHPTAIMRSIIKERMEALGIEKDADLVERSGVPVGTIRGILRGKRRNGRSECPAPILARNEAIAEALGLEPAILHLTMMCEAGVVGIGLGGASSYGLARRHRGKLQGALHGHRYHEATTSIECLRKLGIDEGVVSTLESHRDQPVSIVGDEWMHPYLRLIDYQRSQLSSS